MKARIHVFVAGRVQGVYFRGQAEAWADDLNLTGWIRNLRDGRVELVAEGEREPVEELIGRLKIGPPSARVDSVDVAWEDYRGEFDGFILRPTGF